MFENLGRLAGEVDNLVTVARASGNQKLQDDVHRFVVQVSEEVDKAFSDVHQVLGEIGFLKPSELSEDKVNELQAKLADTYSRDKFKKVLKICDRLHVLAEHFRDHIEPHLAGGVRHSSQLFWLLHKHEGAFIYTIKQAVDEITKILDDYRSGSNIDAARARARLAQQELRACLDKVTHAHHQFLGGLPQGTSRLLDPNKVADEILRRSPWFSGFFYLAVALLLLTAITIVAGNVSPWSLPIVLAGTFGGLTLIGAFQLRNDGRLSEKNFLQLVDLALRRVLLPLTKSKPVTIPDSSVPAGGEGSKDAEPGPAPDRGGSS